MIFTPRERDLIAGLGQGLSNREIAARHNLTEGSVKVAVHRLYRKTGSVSRLDLALRYRAGEAGPRSPNDLMQMHLSGMGWREGAD
ncbi:MAG TPA: helix-turn-helix transcriptional regulator [Bryobacteraceae bacterium]|jgi:two-component system nitrate/nitrite response regulator NarP|nr:helix-turn-helix transcriptional regulator [Bryobacteraceae bacterium]